ncbi:RNA polymerase sigma factor [Alkaliphilus transvaalensis]|uniref:hypothetical protein n=1 Tax=Alkaliphilus transvaalensis TaxID=114628 RepID=UPI0004798628|nr:hypothetical protein [Alkaliphilus transvaalensis]
MKLGHLISSVLGNNASVASNRSIIKDIRKKDVKSFMRWMQSKRSKYYKIAWSYLYNHHDIEDIFQNHSKENKEGIKYYVTSYDIKLESLDQDIFSNSDKDSIDKIPLTVQIKGYHETKNVEEEMKLKLIK